jgi:16S rRNA processing protein RimM
VEIHSDVPGRFSPGLKLSALAENGTRRELRVEGIWPHKGNLILKFAGIDTISQAEAVAGCELQIPREQRGRLDPGWDYVSELVGCAVLDGQREIGQIQDVRFGAGEAPLLVVAGEDAVHEIPYAEAYLKSVDIGGKRIEMQLPEGLLQVNAPLTAEEKEQQRKRAEK